MPYGFKFNDSQGVPILEIEDSTPRLVSIQDVTVPSSGTTTVSVSSAATTTNSSVVVDSGASAQVSSTGQVTIIGSAATSGNTKLRLLICEF